MEFTNVLDWITSPDGGAFIIIAAALSWAFEDMKWWQDLTGKLKALIILGASILLGLLTVFLQSQPDVVAAIEPYANVVVYIVGAWIVTQGFHKVDPKRSENNAKDIETEKFKDAVG